MHTIISSFLFNSGTMEHYNYSEFKKNINNSQFARFMPLIYLSNSLFMSVMILLYAVPSMNTLVSSANSIEKNKSDALEKSLIYNNNNNNNCLKSNIQCIEIRVQWTNRSGPSMAP